MNGFGVITSTPGLDEVVPPLMCFGLPSRSAKTTTVSQRPVVALVVPLGVDEAGSTSRFMSSPVPRGRRRRPAGRRPPLRLARSRRRTSWLNETPWPGGVAWKSEMIFVSTGLGVEYATRLSVTESSCVAAAALAIPGARRRPATAAPPAMPAADQRRTDRFAVIVFRLNLFTLLRVCPPTWWVYNIRNADSSNKNVGRSARRRSPRPGRRVTMAATWPSRPRPEPHRVLGRVPSGALGDHAPAQRRPAERARPDAERLRGAAAPLARRGRPDAPRRPRAERRPHRLRDHAPARRARACRLRREGQLRDRRPRLVREADDRRPRRSSRTPP